MLCNCRSGGGSHRYDESLVQDLTSMIETSNEYAKKYRQVRAYVEQGVTSNFCLRLIRHRSKDARMHNLPTCDEVAVLILGDDRTLEKGRDIIVKHRSGDLERIQETHVAFIPWQYPLLFPYDEDGFHENIPTREADDDDDLEDARKQRSPKESGLLSEYKKEVLSLALLLTLKDCSNNFWLIIIP